MSANTLEKFLIGSDRAYDNDPAVPPEKLYTLPIGVGKYIRDLISNGETHYNKFFRPDLLSTAANIRDRFEAIGLWGFDPIPGVHDGSRENSSRTTLLLYEHAGNRRLTIGGSDGHLWANIPFGHAHVDISVFANCYSVIYYDPSVGLTAEPHKSCAPFSEETAALSSKISAVMGGFGYELADPEWLTWPIPVKGSDKATPSDGYGVFRIMHALFGED